MKKRHIIVLALCWLHGHATAELVEIGDAQMSAISGQSGIALGLTLDVNTEKFGSGSYGQPLASLDGCSGIGNPCRLALQFENRDDQWLVLKDFYGNVLIDTIHLDGGKLEDANDSKSYFDASRFEDEDGNCLVAGGCTTTNLDQDAAMVFSYPALSASYNPGSGIASNYTSFQMALTIGRVAVEHGPTGYDADDNGSFMGVKVADNNGHLAGAQIGGTAYLFGF